MLRLQRDAAADRGQALIAMPEQTRERHAVQRAARRAVRRMGVHVSIDPDQTERAAQRLRGAFPGADGARMIASQHDRHITAADTRFYVLRESCAYAGHCRDNVTGACSSVDRVIPYNSGMAGP